MPQPEPQLTPQSPPKHWQQALMLLSLSWQAEGWADTTALCCSWAVVPLHHFAVPASLCRTALKPQLCLLIALKAVLVPPSVRREAVLLFLWGCVFFLHLWRCLTGPVCKKHPTVCRAEDVLKKDIR